MHHFHSQLSAYGLLLLSLTLTGCAPTLKQWTAEELSPYLVKELGEHPRFKQQPIILVDMHGGQVEAQIDSLTATIRDQAFNALLQSNGANVVWQASSHSLQHHRHLQDLQCHPKQKSRFYIGFDLKPVNNQFQLSVKALDPEQGRWVSGFGKTWQGKLSKQEQQQLAETRPDEMLRGLRPLPFTEQQKDLLANYLAKNVSCLLQQSSLDKLYIYPENNPQQAAYINDTLALVGNYLSRFNEVHIVNTPKAANIILKAQLHPIDNELHQLWLIAEDKQADGHIKGTDTAAYVTLSAAALRLPVQPVPQPVAVIVAPQPERVVIQAPVATHLFSTLKLISPIGEPFCRTTNPWAMGEYAIPNKQPITHCFGLKISVNQEAEVFLLNKNVQGFFRLLPDNGQTRFQLFAGEQLRYPETELFDLASHVRQESIYAIAVNKPSVARKLRQLLEAMPVCCDNHPDNINWAARLNAFHQQYGAYMDWQVVQVRR